MPIQTLDHSSVTENASNGNGRRLGNGEPQPPEYFAKLTMEEIEHQIGLRNPVNRAYFAILRCSRCYPHFSGFAVRPQVDGSFEKFVEQLHERIHKQRPLRKEDIRRESPARDDRGELIPLSWKDLAVVGNLAYTVLARALRRLRSEGVLAEDHPFRLLPYPVHAPPFERIGESEDETGKVYCAGTEISDKSFGIIAQISERINFLQNYLGLTLKFSGVEGVPPEYTAQVLEQLCARRREADQRTRAEVKAALENSCARIGIIIERSLRSNKHSSSSVLIPTVVVKPEPAAAPAEPEPEPPTPIFPTKKSEPEPEDPKPAIAEAIRQNGATPDQAAIDDIARRCRLAAPDCTAGEIAHFVHERAPRCRDRTRLVGFLMRAVPACFEGQPFRDWRARREREIRDGTAQELKQQSDAEYWRKQMLADLANPDIPDGDKRAIRFALQLPADEPPDKT